MLAWEVKLIIKATIKITKILCFPLDQVFLKTRIFKVLDQESIYLLPSSRGRRFEEKLKLIQKFAIVYKRYEVRGPCDFNKRDTKKRICLQKNLYAEDILSIHFYSYSDIFYS